jgi:hypothetical protein
MNKPTDKELADMRSAAKLASSFPEIEHEIDGMSRSTMLSVFADIRNGTLTPDKAMSYWMEMYSYSRLIKRFETKAALATKVTTQGA